MCSLELIPSVFIGTHTQYSLIVCMCLCTCFLPTAEDIVRKSDVPHRYSSDDVSEGATGVVQSGSQSDPTNKSKEVGSIITQNQAEHLLSGKPNGTFLVRELDGSAHDPSLTAINTHDISVV